MSLQDFFPSRHDIILGRSFDPLARPVVRLGPSDQATHATIWGRTGSGKSKLLESLFPQNLQKGQGACIIEPHHDLSFDTLSTLVADGFFRRPGALDQLIYID